MPPKKKHNELGVEFPPINPATIPVGRGAVLTALPGGGATFPAALPPGAAALVMLPSATRFLACAAAAPAAFGPPALSAMAGRLAVAEDARREAARDDIALAAESLPRGRFRLGLGSRQERRGDCEEEEGKAGDGMGRRRRGGGYFRERPL